MAEGIEFRIFPSLPLAAFVLIIGIDGLARHRYELFGFN